MKGFAVCLVFFLVLNVSMSRAQDPVPSEVSRFLDSRKLVSVIYFQPGSSALSSKAKQSVDRVIPRLSLLDKEKVLIRIEGFAYQEGVDTVSVPLSLDRALSVMGYLNKTHHLDTHRFLIGCGARELAAMADDKGSRAEIVLYDKILDLDNAPVTDLILNW